jgi:signal peptidase I
VRFVGARRGSIFELVFIVAFAIGLALAVQTWAVKPFQIPSESMEPTLDVGERVLVNRLSTRLGADPELGDVVVFHPPLNAVGEGQQAMTLQQCGAGLRSRRPGQACPEPGRESAEENFIKRVVAGPGDRLRIIDGIPVVDGKRVEGDWEIVPCRARGTPCDYPRAITIPPNHYFMMGDNRPGSDDSRFWGPVPRDWIVGEAFATYWPPDRIGSP